jgi:hypothetical protein
MPVSADIGERARDTIAGFVTGAAGASQAVQPRELRMGYLGFNTVGILGASDLLKSAPLKISPVVAGHLPSPLYKGHGRSFRFQLRIRCIPRDLPLPDDGREAGTPDISGGLPTGNRLTYVGAGAARHHSIFHAD